MLREDDDSFSKNVFRIFLLPVKFFRDFLPAVNPF